MLFNENGLIKAPVVITGEGDGVIPADSIDVKDLRTALKLDLLLLELEESLGQDITIHIDGKAINVEGGRA